MSFDNESGCKFVKESSTMSLAWGNINSSAFCAVFWPSQFCVQCSMKLQHQQYILLAGYRTNMSSFFNTSGSLSKVMIISHGSMFCLQVLYQFVFNDSSANTS
jgi:hypothetical protein